MARKKQRAARTLAQQIMDAYEASDMSLSEIREITGLDCDLTSLSRKLRDKQKLSTHECELLAEALGIVVSTSARAA